LPDRDLDGVLPGSARVGRPRAAVAARHRPVSDRRDHRAGVLPVGGRRRQAGGLRGAPMAEKRTTIIRGGRLIKPGDQRAAAADVLIDGDTIAAVGPAGLPAPADAIAIDARDRLMHPGLINAHMHGHGNLAKGMGDRWTLELLLPAGPWITGGRTLEDKYLTTYVGAIEMLLKGCTACYDLTVEFPLPSVEGLDACGRAYADAGMRAVLAPMVAELSF